MKQIMYYLHAKVRYSIPAFPGVFFLLMLYASGAFANGEVPEGNTWIKDATVQKVTFYHKIITCNNQSVVLLKFENANRKNVKIAWNDLYTTVQDAAKVEGASGKKQLLLLPGETASVSCDDMKCKECMILSKAEIPTHKVDITQYEFKNIEAVIQ